MRISVLDSWRARGEETWVSFGVYGEREKGEMLVKNETRGQMNLCQL